jgi:hypothetical protein
MLGMEPSASTREVALKAKGIGMGRSYTYLIDPLVAKSLKNEEGFKDPQQLSEWVIKEMGVPDALPERFNVIVVGGETNPFWVATDFSHFQTILIDTWIPKTGIKKDARPLRMPRPVTCSDGTCGIL